uniref:Uncharacterized protein n=1 Tax=Rhizophora mucronata TaxID=61149 RepID=A0A2P2Q6P6_RHIMU
MLKCGASYNLDRRGILTRLEINKPLCHIMCIYQLK